MTKKKRWSGCGVVFLLDSDSFFRLRLQNFFDSNSLNWLPLPNIFDSVSRLRLRPINLLNFNSNSDSEHFQLLQWLQLRGWKNYHSFRLSATTPIIEPIRLQHRLRVETDYSDSDSGFWTFSTQSPTAKLKRNTTSSDFDCGLQLRPFNQFESNSDSDSKTWKQATPFHSDSRLQLRLTYLYVS